MLETQSREISKMAIAWCVKCRFTKDYKYVCWWWSRERIKFKYCKSRIFCIHSIFVFFARSGFRTKIESMRNARKSAAVSGCRKISCVQKVGGFMRTKYSGITVWRRSQHQLLFSQVHMHAYTVYTVIGKIVGKIRDCDFVIKISEKDTICSLYPFCGAMNQ